MSVKVGTYNGREANESFKNCRKLNVLATAIHTVGVQFGICQLSKKFTTLQGFTKFNLQSKFQAV